MRQTSVFGLGKVGMTLVSCLGAAGHRVTGVDINATLVDSLNRRSPVTDEPGVKQRIAAIPR
ncbi:MAG TPA: hypothetical protein VL359_14460, partial [bacterium]|nr:hypothetical protein [bacterium]